MAEQKIRYHLPGLRYNYPLNMFWISLLETHPEFFRDGIEIASFFGCFPLSLWNGGRLCPKEDQCDAGFVMNVIKNINAKNIPIRYTFTNPLITEADLDDEFCNFCLKAGDNGKNEVLVFSPILEEYIRKNYPSYAIDSSTCKEIRDVETLNREIEKDYKYVVLDYNFNNKWDILDGLQHREKIEVLVNCLCTPGCKRRGGHYELVGKNQRIIMKNRQAPPDKQIPIIPWGCEYGDKNCLFTIKDYPTFISPEMIEQEYLPRGYNNFKIEGRTANLFSLIETYCYFMLKPECVGEARLLLMRNLEQMHVVNVTKPKPAKFVMPT
ncbi:hypothetical protein SAMN02910292_01953 [Lachnospiraceae bacterium XBB2008]|nr:hypothetical protein SAMN02910292_01953 [Lachnospiraceae bacterium XBB2008]